MEEVNHFRQDWANFPKLLIWVPEESVTTFFLRFVESFITNREATHRQWNASHLDAKSASRIVGSHELRHKDFNG